MTFNKLNNLEGKVAVITGGAGQIGYATGNIIVVDAERTT
jgi:NAD(P)-dependent dehydrogenase (short-subunit alcohol dehydrogenase family)